MNEATDAMAIALEVEDKMCQETMETLIADILSEVVDTKLKALNIPKNSTDMQQNHLSKPQTHGTKRKSSTTLDHTKLKMRWLNKMEQHTLKIMIEKGKETQYKSQSEEEPSKEKGTKQNS